MTDHPTRIRPDARSVHVELTELEEAFAAAVAYQRYVAVMLGRVQPRGGQQQGQQQLRDRQLGAFGEFATCKELDFCFSARLDLDGVFDVGDYYGVRTAERHHHNLLVQTWDKPERPYIFVTGFAGHYWLRGWLWGFEAQDYVMRYPPGCNTNNPRHAMCHVIPAAELTDMAELPEHGTLCPSDVLPASSRDQEELNF